MTFIARPKFFPGVVELSGRGSSVAEGREQLTVTDLPEEQVVIEKWTSGLTSIWRYERGHGVAWDGDIASD
jgi:hypothetical protein